MSILTGLLQDRGAFASESELRRLSLTTEQYATGESKLYLQNRLGMAFQAYVSHQRSAMEVGPRVDRYGNALSFDGRLDNCDELAKELGLDPVYASDGEIVLGAFERWGGDCFARFTGDWALALWCEREQKLFLARDHAGTRTLYFQKQPHRIFWSTYLEPFLQADARLALSEKYAACYLACLPVRELTPYEGIFSVLPGEYLSFDSGGMAWRTHWSPLRMDAVRYTSDTEYEEHFFVLFRQSVARRTGPGAPILAELSGGMDSTSIVCMSDHIRHWSDPDAEILDTLSYFDDSEASFDERAYFTITENRRGKSGVHLDAAYSQRTFDPARADDGAHLFPGADSFSVSQERKLFDLVQQSGYRSILSGIGGDEVLGGVPNALPELADHLVAGDLRQLARQCLAWSLVDRSPILAILSNTARYTSRLYLQKTSHTGKLPPWLSARLGNSLRDSDGGREAAVRRWGAEPHQLDNASTWGFIMETLPHLAPQASSRLEYRYPMLDKDLVNYLFSIPREQLLRPGRRRSLMRRALKGIVPLEILERRRKAYQLRAPLAAIRNAHLKLRDLLVHSAIADLGFVDSGALLDGLERTAHGSVEEYQALLRAIAYELWLQASDRYGSRNLVTSSPGVLDSTLATL
jgi:asparagine synthase (glutamine-hydrolysing)